MRVRMRVRGCLFLVWTESPRSVHGTGKFFTSTAPPAGGKLCSFGVGHCSPRWDRRSRNVVRRRCGARHFRPLKLRQGNRYNVEVCTVARDNHKRLAVDAVVVAVGADAVIDFVATNGLIGVIALVSDGPCSSGGSSSLITTLMLPSSGFGVATLSLLHKTTTVQ